MFKILNIKNKKQSTKKWKTYRGALKNCKQYDIVLEANALKEALEWLQKYPEWVYDRVSLASKTLDK